MPRVAGRGAPRRGANAVRVGAAPPLRRRRKKHANRKHKAPPRNARPKVQVKSAIPNNRAVRAETSRPAQSTVNRCIADLIVQKSVSDFCTTPNLPQGRCKPHPHEVGASPDPTPNNAGRMAGAAPTQPSRPALHRFVQYGQPYKLCFIME